MEIHRVKPEDLPVGPESAVVRSEQAGKVLWLSTDDIVRIAREAGAPKEKGAGVVLHAKLGGECIKTVYSLKSMQNEAASWLQRWSLQGNSHRLCLARNLRKK